MLSEFLAFCEYEIFMKNTFIQVGSVALLVARRTNDRKVAGSSTGSAVAAASDIHRQMPTHMADIRRDWLTNQNTD